jgi:hypothetical protein
MRKDKMVKSPCFDRAGLRAHVEGHGGLDGGEMAAKVCRNDGVMDRCRRCVKMI